MDAGSIPAASTTPTLPDAVVTANGVQRRVSSTFGSSTATYTAPDLSQNPAVGAHNSQKKA